MLCLEMLQDDCAINQSSLAHLRGAIQQADESMLCLEMLQDDCAINQSSLTHLRKEADAIVAAFTSIVSRLGGRSL